MTESCRSDLFLIAVVLSSFGGCYWAAESLPPFAFACSYSSELHVIWPGQFNSSGGNAAGFRVCLSYHNSFDNHMQLIVLNSISSSVAASDGTLLHLTFKIAPEHTMCQYFYRWKIEQLSMLDSTGASTENCAASTPEQECEIDLGRRKDCSGWRPSQINSLNCQPDLVDLSGGNYSALRRQLCRQESPKDIATQAAWVAPVAATVGCVFVAAAAVLMLVCTLSKRREERLDKRIIHGAAHIDSSQFAPSMPMPLSRLFSDDAKLKRVLESRIWQSAEFKICTNQQQCQRPIGLEFLTINPDSGEPIL